MICTPYSDMSTPVHRTNISQKGRKLCALLSFS